LRASSGWTSRSMPSVHGCGALTGVLTWGARTGGPGVGALGEVRSRRVWRPGGSETLARWAHIAAGRRSALNLRSRAGPASLGIRRVLAGVDIVVSLSASRLSVGSGLSL